MRWLIDEQVRARVERLELPFNADGIDPYGTSRDELALMFSIFGWMYRGYFPVTVEGIHHVPPRGRAMLVGNHSGGWALDAMIALSSCFFELEPPRLAQGMAEKFIARMPFASRYAARTGQLTGLPEHAAGLLEDERLLLVFPEGARGTAKLYGDRHTLVDFGTGFLRLALQTRSPIVPFAFLGGGEAVPTVANLYRLGRLLGVPYVPITPYLLPVPRRVPLAIHYGEPMRFDGSGDEDDEEIAGHVAQVQARIAALIEHGYARRRCGRSAS